MADDIAVVRAVQAQRRLQAREMTPLWERLRQAQQRVALRSTVSAQALETRTSTGHPESQEPDGVDWDTIDSGLPHDDRMRETGLGPIERLLKPIENAIVDLERACDFDQGLSTARSTATLLSHEKDAELVERWKGVDSATVARQAPHMGSQRAIERARARLGLQAKTGLSREKAA